MFAVVVSFQIKQDQMDAFLPLMLANAKASLLEEPGCHQFDVCTDPSRPTEVFLYELYSDTAAFEAHKGTPHFLEFDGQTAAMIHAKFVSTYGNVTQ